MITICAILFSDQVEKISSVFTADNEQFTFVSIKMWSNVQAEDLDQVEDKKMLSKLDALDLGKWHIFVALALGLVWLFDGYEVTVLSLYRHQIEQQTSDNTFKSLVTAYQMGGITGSLLFGISSFIIGRRKIFLITLAIYFVGVMLSGIQTSPQIFMFARFLTGVSVGGQFTAIFTAVDQFLPPKYRGRVNIAIDGTWHLGGALASLLTMLVGETQHWRLMFLFGLIGIISLLLLRRNVPESPRWLILKGRMQESNSIILAIQEAVKKGNILMEMPEERSELSIQRGNTFCGYIQEILRILKEALTIHTRKFIVSFALIFCQAFFFSQVYYQYPDILAEKFGMNQQSISRCMLPISLMNFLSTLLLGSLFDEVGRRVLILITYLTSAVLVIISYQIDHFVWRELTVVLLFLFASPASSSANLIASEIFPTSSRTLIMFVMFILSMSGGIVGIWLNNYLVSSLLLAMAGILAFLFCPNSEKKSLQQIQKL